VKNRNDSWFLVFAGSLVSLTSIQKLLLFEIPCSIFDIKKNEAKEPFAAVCWSYGVVE
jgi:hypothetical protein